MIVLTVHKMAEAGCGSPVVIIGTHTDVLVMLAAHATAFKKLYMLYKGRPLTLFCKFKRSHDNKKIVAV